MEPWRAKQMRWSPARNTVRLLVAVAALLQAQLVLAATVDVPYVASEPDIHAGAGWHEGHLLFEFNASYAVGDNSVRVYGVWSDAALLVAADVEDQALYATSLPRDSGIAWENDAIELLFDPTLKGGSTIAHGDPAFRQYIFTIAGSVFDAVGCCVAADPSWNGTADFAVTLRGTLNDAGTGYFVAMRIPWADLGVTPRDGLEIGFDVANDDRDDFSVESPVIEADWAGLAETFAQPSRWGRLRLVGGQTPVDAGTGDGATADGSGSGGGGGGTVPTPEDSCGCHASQARGHGAVILVGLLLVALRSNLRNREGWWSALQRRQRGRER